MNSFYKIIKTKKDIKLPHELYFYYVEEFCTKDFHKSSKKLSIQEAGIRNQMKIDILSFLIYSIPHSVIDIRDIKE